jgi:hypothetical protein
MRAQELKIFASEIGFDFVHLFTYSFVLTMLSQNCAQ